MFRPTLRFTGILKSSRSSLAPARTTAHARRLLTTATPPLHGKPRSWRSSAVRWGIAIAGIYYYNTAELFAEQPAQYSLDPKAGDYDDSENLALSQPSREKKSISPDFASAEMEGRGRAENASAPNTSSPQSGSISEPVSSPSVSDPAGLEDEASSEGAFNPATGEINWDCPCLGGMAHGPCGEQFRAAFSCFVFSTEEPKGMDCIENFKGMQECFRAHPDVYAAELGEDGEDGKELDSELDEERKELVKDIRERRERGKPGELETRGGEKRLLEVDPPVKRKPLIGGSSSSHNSHPHPPPPHPSSSPSPPPPPPPPSSAPVESSPQKSFGNIPDPLPTPENNDHAKSQTAVEEQQDHGDTDSGDVFDKDSKLMPAAWHDGRQSGPRSAKDTEK